MLVLLFEDDPASARLMRAILEPLGCRVLSTANGAEGLELLKRDLPRLVFLDLGLADMHGLHVLARIREGWPGLQVIILTGDTGVESAVRAIQMGASNYFTKPVNTKQIEAAAKGALERAALEAELDTLRGQLSRRGGLEERMGSSAAILRLQEQLLQVAGTSMSVLVHGETGAGKEVVARAIHDASPRSRAPFIALDCGAIPESLLESELFGHERGAFSGADRRREGHFQLAQGGTLFLDEIANLPLGPQAKLLRVLQERQLQPLGAGKPLRLDVRIVAASNHDLEREAEAGRFRQDLYFRLAEFRLSIPALRERPDDIPYLAQRFLDEARVELRKPLTGFEPAALELLRAQPWGGNVRELRNVVRQAVLLGQGPELRASELEKLLRRGRRTAASPGAPPAGEIRPSLSASGKAGLERAEREAIAEALGRSKGNILAAARDLRVDNKTLHVKLKKYAIRARAFAPEG